MPTTYTQAGDNIEAQMRRVMAKYHGRLTDVEANVGVLIAFNPDGDAVKLNGYPCAATVRIVSLKDRAAGMPDAQIVLDQNTWDGLDQAERDALFDHEIEHLQTVPNKKTNQPKRDDLGRPKLRMKKHDAQVGIFKNVIERNGPKALDAQIAKDFITEFGQLLMWAEDKKKVG